MNAIVSIVTAASVLVHVVFGCCIAHSHGASTGFPLPSVTPHAHHHAHDCHRSHLHEHDGSESGENHPEWPHKHCDEGACAAVVGSKTGPQLQAEFETFAATPCIAIIAAQAGSAPYADYFSLQHDLGPPLRPHLYYCVLLV